MEFQYQQYFDVVVEAEIFNPYFEYVTTEVVELDPALPEFIACQSLFLIEEPIVLGETIYPDEAEGLVDEPLECQNNILIEEYVVPWEVVYDDSTEDKTDLVENLQEYWVHEETLLAAMPDFFDPYFDDILEKAIPFDIATESEVSEAWYGLNITPEDITPIQHNFGDPYGPGKFGIPGQYLCPYTPSSSTFALAADTVYYVPMYIPYQMHISELGIWISTRDDASVARIGLYSSQRGYITSLIYSNIVSLNTTGYRMVPADVWLTKGLYFVAIITNSSTAVLKASYSDNVQLLGYINPDDMADDNFFYSYYSQSQTYSDGLPDPVDSEDLTMFKDSVPTIIVRLA